MFSSRIARVLLVALVVAGFALAIALSYRRPMLELAARDEGLTFGQWEYLSDLPWPTAGTGWVAVANEGQPLRDEAFLGGPIRIGGYVYEKGIGTYSLSEIEFRLNGEYNAFESEMGVDDSVPAGRGGAIFQVFLDDALVYASEAMKRTTSNSISHYSSGCAVCVSGWRRNLGFPPT
ncbi:MAG: NPCBM/NEW2 domain-containing protein [Chloroflexi bacterium]|nr:NPCBM/NEW2 domain-containing protein [Chloroflexota bacterium]